MIFSCFEEVSEKEIAVGVDTEIVVKDKIFESIFFFEKMTDIFSDLPVTEAFGEREMFGTFRKEFSLIESHKAFGSTSDNNRFGFLVISKDFITETPETALNLR